MGSKTISNAKIRDSKIHNNNNDLENNPISAKSSNIYIQKSSTI